MRGVTQTHLDDKVLILLNGRPLRDAGQGGINGDIYSSFPLELIRQIEIIRGPGSVLYGTNAFSGVINIVTFEASSEAKLQIDATAGTFGTRQLTVSGSKTAGGAAFVGSISKQRSEGDTFSNTDAEIGPAGDYETGGRALESVFRASYRGLTVNSILNKVETKSGNNLLSYPSTDWEVSRRFLDVGYSFPLKNDWNLTANITYNGMNNTAFIIGGTNRFFQTKSRGYLAEISVAGELGEKTNLVFGTVYDRLKGENVSDGELNTDINTWRASFYAQADYSVSPSLNLSSGFQLNKPSGSHIDISPRIAGVYTLSSNWSLKLAYEEAYRSAFGLDLFLNASFLVGNENLKPETIKTYSAQIAFGSNTADVAVSYYNSKHNDLIIRTIDNSGQVTLENAGSVAYEGLEIEYQWRWAINWSLQGNASYQSNKNDEGLSDTTFQPNWMVKGGIAQEGEAYSMAVYASYFSEPTQLVDFNPELPELNPDADAYFLVSANLSIQAGQWTGNMDYDNLTLGFYVDNLLDEEIYYPEISRQAINTIPHHRGRSFHIKARYRF